MASPGKKNGILATEPTIESTYEEQEDSFGDLGDLPQERSAPHELVREFVSEEGIEGKTDLTRRQVSAFTRLEIFDRDFPEFEVWRLKKFLLLKISENGKSRDGLLNMLRGNVAVRTDMMPGGPGELQRGRRF